MLVDNEQNIQFWLASLPLILSKSFYIYVCKCASLSSNMSQCSVRPLNVKPFIKQPIHVKAFTHMTPYPQRDNNNVSIESLNPCIYLYRSIHINKIQWCFIAGRYEMQHARQFDGGASRRIMKGPIRFQSDHLVPTLEQLVHEADKLLQQAEINF